LMNIDEWMKAYVKIVRNIFTDRIVFIGLQGSCSRKEMTAESDIDVVLILDTVSLEDLHSYRNAIADMPDRDKICGFVSGMAEISNWYPADLFQFYYDTKPVLGSLNFLLPKISLSDIQYAVRIGACNIYHMCVHNVVHEHSMEVLKELYKSSIFVLQAHHFLLTQNYISRREDLLNAVTGTDLHILQTAVNLKKEPTISEKQFDACTKNLLEWSSDLIQRYKS